MISRFLLSVGGLCLLATLLPAQTPDTELKAELSSVGYFIGDWECAGKFDASGKAIEAHQHFAPELDGAWMLFRHDDKPPFNYHALAEWGWDAGQKQFVMSVQDSIGGFRVFRSAGFEGNKLQWDGDSLGIAWAPTQRFSFERLDARRFTVSYFRSINGGWIRVDSSTCSKQ